MGDLLFRFLETFNPLWAVIGKLWAVWLFLTILYVALQLWLAYRQLLYKRSEANFVLMEIVVPRELHKNPHAMEQIFASIHAIRNSPANRKEKWWDGEVTLWFTFEVISLGGELHFFMRIPKKHRLMVEAAFYAQYPDIELFEAHEDYVNRFPARTVPELIGKGYEFFGNELILEKDDTYPIRTYIEFSESPQEESQLDPIGALLETIKKAKPSEVIGIQILVRALTTLDWRNKGLRVIEKTKERVGKRQILTPLGEFVMIDRTPGETELLKVLDHKISKPAFETVLRYIYMSPREIYSDGFARRGVLSAFNQYASESRNRFRHNTKVWTRTQIWFPPYLFPNKRGFARKVKMLRNFQEARLEEDTFIGTILDAVFFFWRISLKDLWKYHFKIGIRTASDMVLNTEELATIFHLPTHIVLTGPLIKRMESRKVGPPAGLPIYGEEGEELPGIK